MFFYSIAKTTDENAFFHALDKIEANLKNLKKEKLLTDVDGTQIQIYSNANGRIKVRNDYYVDAVYAESDVKLDGIL